VDCCLPYFASALSLAHCWPVCLSSLCLPKAPCLSPLFQSTYSTLSPLLHVSFQFLIYSGFLFCVCGVSQPRGLCWLILGVAGGIPCDALCSCVDLPNVSQTGLELVSGSGEPSCFLSVTWHREAFHGLGVQGVKVLILLDALFPPSVAPASQ
jgi:hypothetical protein